MSHENTFLSVNELIFVAVSNNNKIELTLRPPENLKYSYVNLLAAPLVRV